MYKVINQFITRVTLTSFPICVVHEAIRSHLPLKFALISYALTIELAREIMFWETAPW